MSGSKDAMVRQTMEEKAAAIAATNFIAHSATKLYRLGLTPGAVSKAQVLAVGEKVRRAATLEGAEGAESAAASFLNHQMAKLKNREKSHARPASWRTEIGEASDRRPIGEAVIEWIHERRYLPQAESPAPSLALLQKFWHLVETLYLYQAVTGKKAEINEEIGT